MYVTSNYILYSKANCLSLFEAILDVDPIEIGTGSYYSFIHHKLKDYNERRAIIWQNILECTKAGARFLL